MARRLIVIGAGPAGLTAAIYAGRGRLEPLVFTGTNIGGQILLSSSVENFPGFPEGIVGADLSELWLKQAQRFGAEFLYASVSSVDFSSRPLQVYSGGRAYESEAVIIAMGASAKWLGLPSERRLIGRGVSSCATCDGVFFQGKDVVVVGGGDTAIDDAVFLTRFAKSVSVVHRGERLRASRILQERAFEDGRIRFIWSSVVEEVMGENQVEGVKLRNRYSGEERRVECQGVFVAIGYQPNTEIFRGQLDLDEQGYIVVRNETETSVEGVFAAGDIHDTRYRQAITAAGAGCKAALDAEKYLQRRGLI